MNTNRYETTKPRKAVHKSSTDIGPAWWGLAIGSTCAFVLAIFWLLGRSV